MLSVKLAKHIGFCAGVRRAINIVEKVLSQRKTNVYSLGAVIHNSQVIEDLKRKGLVLVKNINEVKDNSVLILPSHGSPKSILEQAKIKRLKLVDVICPYVSSVHLICKKIHQENLELVIFGDKKHPEIKALKDIAPNAFIVKDLKEGQFSGKKIGIISQTTQDRHRFFEAVAGVLNKNPNVLEVHIFNTICLDTTNRQEEVKRLAGQVDALLVIGSKTSANTNRLFNIGRKVNKKTYLVESGKTPLEKVLKGVKEVGIISGASAPDWLVKQIEKRIKKIKNI